MNADADDAVKMPKTHCICAHLFVCVRVFECIAHAATLSLEITFQQRIYSGGNIIKFPVKVMRKC